MNLRRIKHTFLRLSAEEKVAGAGALLVLIGIFMPWYSVVMSFDKKNISENGLSGDIGVIGFVILLMVILALLVLIGEHLHIKIPKLGYTREQMLFFLMGQSAFLVLLCIAVYTKRSLEFTDAELRFGIYLALVGAFLATFAIFSQIQKLKNKEIQEFFEHEEPIEKKGKDHKEEYLEEEPEEDQMLFEEETTQITYPEPEEEIIEEIEEIKEIEEIEEEPEEEIIQKNEEAGQELEEDLEKSDPETQADYFMREAGVEEEEDDVNDVETEDIASQENEDEEKEKKDKGLSMGFYED